LKRANSSHEDVTCKGGFQYSIKEFTGGSGTERIRLQLARRGKGGKERGETSELRDQEPSEALKGGVGGKKGWEVILSGAAVLRSGGFNWATTSAEG